MDKPGGALIVKLHSASPLKEAGIKAGDVVTAVDGKQIRDPAEMRFRMAMVPIGNEMLVNVLNKGKTKDYKVAATAPPEDPPRHETLLDGQNPLSGAVVSNINPAVSTEMGIDEEEGVVVTDIKGRGIAAMRVVRPGDVIVSVNGRETKTVDDLKKRLERGSVRGWELVISRDGHKSQIYVR